MMIVYIKNIEEKQKKGENNFEKDKEKKTSEVYSKEG